MTAPESSPEPDKQREQRVQQSMDLIRSAAWNNTVNVGQAEYDRVLADHPDLAKLDGDLLTRLEVYEDRRWKWCWLFRDDEDRLVMQGGGFPTQQLAAADADAAIDRLDEGDDT